MNEEFMIIDIKKERNDRGGKVFNQNLEKRFLVELFPKKVRVRKVFCFRCGGREFEVDSDHCHCKSCGYVQYYAYASVGC